MEINMKTLLIITLVLLGLVTDAQTISIADLKPDSTNYDNIHVKRISTDSLSSTFAIWIKLKVKMHKHVNHTEQVYVLEGAGNFTIGDKNQSIKKGDFITIPRNTWHGVEVVSDIPLKVISIQSPEFKGQDRIFKK